MFSVLALLQSPGDCDRVTSVPCHCPTAAGTDSRDAAGLENRLVDVLKSSVTVSSFQTPFWIFTLVSSLVLSKRVFFVVAVCFRRCKHILSSDRIC